MMLAKKTIQPNRVERIAALEDGLQVIAIREISDIITVSDKTDLRDADGVNDMKSLKDNAAKTMLLLDRLSKYVMAKRGTVPFGTYDNRLPDEVEKEAERKVVDAIERFRAK